MSYMVLTKHEVLGGDVLVAFHPALADVAGFARWICDRHHGIGADALLVGHELPAGGYRLAVYEPSGALRAPDGGDLACFAQAAAERIAGDARGADAVEINVLAEREHRVRVTPLGEAQASVSVPVGPLGEGREPVRWWEVGVDARRPVRHLDLVGPRTVVAVEDVDAVDLESIATTVDDVSIDIVAPGPERDTVAVGSFGWPTRRSGGSLLGACAAATVAQRWGLAHGSTVHVRTQGGDVSVVIPDSDDGEIVGTATTTAIGTVTVELSPEFAAFDHGDLSERG